MQLVPKNSACYRAHQPLFLGGMSGFSEKKRGAAERCKLVLTFSTCIKHLFVVRHRYTKLIQSRLLKLGKCTIPGLADPLISTVSHIYRSTSWTTHSLSTSFHLQLESADMLFITFATRKQIHHLEVITFFPVPDVLLQ